MADKLIKDMDDNIWREFISICTAKGIRANEELANILSKYNKSEFKKLAK